ncbi:MAG: putative 2OG-Fe(II) oxygenase [Gammaproteobacteria bacterium]|jgi:Flp pilus assembly protein TadD
MARDPISRTFDEQLAGAQGLHQQGRLAEAKAAYDQLIAESPQHPELLRLLGVLNYQNGDLSAAADLFRRAVKAGSKDGRAMEALGCVLAETGREEEAIHCLAQVAAAHPRQQSAIFNLGMLLMNQKGRMEEATRAFQRVVSLDPDNNRARAALARAQLCQGQAWEALRELDRVLAKKPGNVHALAHKIAALSQLGHTPAIESLVDLNSMIHVDRFESTGGFGSAEELNKRLAEHILSHPTLGDERTTTHGMDTGEILDSDDPAILALIENVRRAVNRMAAGLDLEPDHPFMQGRPERWYLTGWGVRMWRGGFQIPHYHRDAWISGVYYVQLPAAVSSADESQQGWIEFGQGPDDIFQQSIAPTRRIAPEEGRLIAFPSYFWHRTLPFEDDQERLCISFNLVPADE